MVGIWRLPNFSIFLENHWDRFLIPKAINWEYIAGPVRTIEPPWQIKWLITKCLGPQGDRHVVSIEHHLEQWWGHSPSNGESCCWGSRGWWAGVNRANDSFSMLKWDGVTFCYPISTWYENTEDLFCVLVLGFYLISSSFCLIYSWIS